MQVRFLNGATVEELKTLPIVPGTVYFLDDGLIYFDTYSGARKCMNGNSTLITPEDIDTICGQALTPVSLTNNEVKF